MARPRPKRSTLPDGSVVVAGKRANGVGSTYYVASRGVWRSTWVDPTTGRRRSVNSATRAEAEKRAATKAIPQLEAAAGAAQHDWDEHGTPEERQLQRQAAAARREIAKLTPAANAEHLAHTQARSVERGSGLGL